MNHTPGPWHIDNFETGTSRQQIVARDRVIASLWQHFDRNNKAGEVATDEANACLIAAAPELLEALSELEAAIRTEEIDNPEPIIQAEKRRGPLSPKRRKERKEDEHHT